MAQKVFKKGAKPLVGAFGAMQALSDRGKTSQTTRKEPAGASATPKSQGGKAKRQGAASSGPPDPTPERKADTLPLASVLPTQQEMDEVVSALEEYTAIQELEAQHKIRKHELAATIAGICKSRHLPGVRHGQIAAYYGGFKTKWSLNRALLLENGVTPQQLKDSMKESKPYVDLRVLDLSKPKTGHGDGEGEED